MRFLGMVGSPRRREHERARRDGGPSLRSVLIRCYGLHLRQQRADIKPHAKEVSNVVRAIAEVRIESYEERLRRNLEAPFDPPAPRARDGLPHVTDALEVFPF